MFLARMTHASCSLSVWGKNEAPLKIKLSSVSHVKQVTL